MGKIMNCPSEYSNTNSIEWFAEMVTMITINKIPPHLKNHAKEFIDVISINI
jgi:hypothetical protein